MGKKTSESRRNFLKTSAGALAASAVVPGKVVAAPKTLDINPNIKDTRVVCCHDPAMVTGNPDPSRWNTIAKQNEYVDGDRVRANIDAMAMALAEESTPGAAWAKIFQKPDSKEWSEVKVAIKANCKTMRSRNDPMNNPRLAVLDKICKALNGLGVPYGSIIIYDDDDEDATVYSSSVGNGLPSGVKVTRRNEALGGRKITAMIPAPYNRNGQCTQHIADGTIDILINVANNKGHNSTWGNATMTMKNHLGTFDPQPHNTDRLFGITKSDAIVGGTPTRQQLNFVDSLWASERGPSAYADHAPHRLVMGTCSPTVDYFTVKKIREDVMGMSHSSSVISRYLSEFGYSANDLEFINVDPVPIKPNTLSDSLKGKAKLSIAMPKSVAAGRFLSFDLSGQVRPVYINIHSANGRRIRSLPLSVTSSRRLKASWDGHDSTGSSVGAGMYIVTVLQNGRAQSKKIKLVK